MLNKTFLKLNKIPESPCIPLFVRHWLREPEHLQCKNAPVLLPYTFEYIFLLQILFIDKTL